MSVQTTYNAAPPTSYEGTIYDADGNEDCRIAINKEASASIAFGRATKFYNAGGDDAVRLPTNAADVIKGIAVLSHAIGALDAVGVQINEVFNVMREGRVSVVCENGCVPGDRLFIRCAAGTLGALRSAADGSNTIDATAQGQWESTAAAGERAILAVNFKTK